ncbi:integrase [Mycobacterium gordonae]|uniref:Integrase n=1 Tax=Mycobacterium gordonae TaxID=1778 RepID=A0A0Q2MBR2_MYCGO|nr:MULTISPECIES: site-specific integrase [Mycobacterium]KQH77215.1 integrase [Mycobacterium gordonae]MDP7729706.1 tyrosine-type recombinase/integrase [Mycobacterium sp. TY813]
MASLRTRSRKDKSTYYAVLYRHGGKQTSTSFEDFETAEKFMGLVDRVGPMKALSSIGSDPALSTMTVGEWVERYIDHRTGLAKSTLADYRSYLKNDIAPTLGPIPLSALTREDVAKWCQAMADGGSSGKTISNKTAFLASALSSAVEAGRIQANPASGHRAPRTEKKDMVCMSRAELGKLLEAVTEHWRPLVEFLVVSGARWGEVTALRPSDIDVDNGTVRITRAWKRTYAVGGYELGAPKTTRSVRTISVPKSTLAKLDLTKEWVFTNKSGGPVRGNGFHERVWQPAVERVWPSADDESQRVPSQTTVRHPRIHDCRHTCASWLIAAGVPMATVSRHLGHESIQTTINLYTHLDRSNMQVASEAMERILR